MRDGDKDADIFVVDAKFNCAPVPRRSLSVGVGPGWNRHRGGCEWSPCTLQLGAQGGPSTLLSPGLLLSPGAEQKTVPCWG